MSSRRVLFAGGVRVPVRSEALLGEWLDRALEIDASCRPPKGRSIFGSSGPYSFPEESA